MLYKNKMISNIIIAFYILFSILSLSICTPPPFIEQMEQIKSGISSIYYEENKFPFLPQTYANSESILELSNSNVTITFSEDYKKSNMN